MPTPWSLQYRPGDGFEYGLSDARARADVGDAQEEEQAEGNDQGQRAIEILYAAVPTKGSETVRRTAVTAGP
jgi:hypothetical protein